MLGMASTASFIRLANFGVSNGAIPRICCKRVWTSRLAPVVIRSQNVPASNWISCSAASSSRSSATNAAAAATSFQGALNSAPSPPPPEPLSAIVSITSFCT